MPITETNPFFNSELYFVPSDTGYVPSHGQSRTTSARSARIHTFGGARQVQAQTRRTSPAPTSPSQRLALQPTAKAHKCHRDSNARASGAFQRAGVSEADPNFPWHLAQLRPNGLSMALRNLERQSLTHFAPIETRTERRAGKFVTREALAFPGYVFVQPGPHAGGIRAINATRGISKLVALGPEPATVPHDLIEALRLRFSPATEVAVPDFAPGDQVQILEGPLADFVAQVEATAPEGRVYLLIDLMGRATRATVDARHLKAMGA